MTIQQNNLRLYRKQSKLTQSDIAYIMALADYSNISHWELGHKMPNVDILLMYHLLFDIPTESFFERQKQELKEKIRERIKQLIEQLKSGISDAKVAMRVAFLESAFTRLSA
jgi:transcriptional regulator with XRE-family HTH domain